MGLQQQFDERWDFNRPGLSEQRFLELLNKAAHPDHSAQVLSQIARAQGLQARFEQALATLEQAQQFQPLSASSQIRLALERGRILKTWGKPQQARPFFLQAWELGQAHAEDFLAIDAAHMLAIVGDVAEQVNWNQKALGLCEKTSDPRARRWRASLYNNLGWTYCGQGDYAKALEGFEKALSERELQGMAEPIRIARWCVAHTLPLLGQVQQALILQQALDSELKAAGQTDAYVAEEMGECLLALGRPAEAKAWFRQAYAELCNDSWFAQNEAARLERLRGLAQEVE